MNNAVTLSAIPYVHYTEHMGPPAPEAQPSTAIHTVCVWLRMIAGWALVYAATTALFSACISALGFILGILVAWTVCDLGAIALCATPLYFDTFDCVKDTVNGVKSLVGWFSK